MTNECKVLIVAGIAVKGLEKRRGRKDLPAGLENTPHLTNGDVRVFQVFQHRLAMDGRYRTCPERKQVCVGDDVHIRQ
jgi:hypothetical protein